MALVTPTTSEVDAAIIAQLEASLNQTIPLLPKSFMRVLSRVLAAVFITLYKYSGFIFLQMFVQTATIKTTNVNGRDLSPLIQWGRLIGVGDPAAAIQAEMQITVIVSQQTGTLPSGTQLIGATNGITYLTIGAVALSAATVTILVRASSDQAGGNGAGAIGNLDVGALMTFVNPLPNVEREATVLNEIVTGADGEATEVYQQRILDRFQKQPQGGAYADYEMWAVEPAGILHAYPYTSPFPGQVDIYIEATVASSGDPDGFPTAAQLLQANDSIIFDLAGVPNRRPANALSNTFSITRVGFDVIVSGLNVLDQATVQANIIVALTDYFLDREPFIPGLSIEPRKDQITNAAVVGIVQDIVSAASGIFGSAIIEKDGTPITLFALGVGEKAKVLTVGFVA